MYGDQYREYTAPPPPRPVQQQANGGGGDRTDGTLSRSKPQLRRLGDGTYAEYESNFNPEIFMRETRDFRDSRKQDTTYAHHKDVGPPPMERRTQQQIDREIEASYDPYNDRYERHLPSQDDQRRYPRQDQAFSNSIAQEQDVMGDYGRPDAYKMNIQGQDRDNESQIDYDIFRQQQQQQQPAQQQNGTAGTMNNLEEQLGYFP